MILWAKKEAVGMPCNQRVELLEVVAGNLRVKLLGTDEIALLAPDEVCGVEFDDTCSVSFDVRGTMRRQHRSFS